MFPRSAGNPLLVVSSLKHELGSVCSSVTRHSLVAGKQASWLAGYNKMGETVISFETWC